MSNLEQTSVEKSEHTNQLFKVLTQISQLDLFLSSVCFSHWRQHFVGQPPSDSLGASCVNAGSSLHQGCRCRDLYIWTLWSELKHVFSEVFLEALPNVQRERVVVSAHKIHNFFWCKFFKQLMERDRDFFSVNQNKHGLFILRMGGFSPLYVSSSMW